MNMWLSFEACYSSRISGQGAEKSRQEIATSGNVLPLVRLEIQLIKLYTQFTRNVLGVRYKFCGIFTLEGFNIDIYLPKNCFYVLENIDGVQIFKGKGSRDFLFYVFCKSSPSLDYSCNFFLTLLQTKDFCLLKMKKIALSLLNNF